MTGDPTGLSDALSAAAGRGGIAGGLGNPGGAPGMTGTAGVDSFGFGLGGPGALGSTTGWGAVGDLSGPPGWSTGDFGSLGFGLTGAGNYGTPGSFDAPGAPGAPGATAGAPGGAPGMAGTAGVGYGQAGVGSQGFGTGSFSGPGDVGNVGWDAPATMGAPAWSSGNFGQYGGFEADPGPAAVAAEARGEPTGPELGDPNAGRGQQGKGGMTSAEVAAQVDAMTQAQQAQAMEQASPFDAAARGEQGKGAPAEAPGPQTETFSTPQQAIDAAFNTLSLSPDVPGTLGPTPGSPGHFADTFGPFGPQTATPAPAPAPFTDQPVYTGPQTAPAPPGPQAPGPQDQPSRGFDPSNLSVQFANPDLGLLGMLSPSQNTALGLGGQTNRPVFDPAIGAFRDPLTGQIVGMPQQPAFAPPVGGG
jgi:hypothetical protein